MRRDGESLRQYRARLKDMRLATDRQQMLERWDHKREGTPETHEHAYNSRQGAIARLFEDGHIDKEQLACACEIAAIAEVIERDVGLKAASFEMRVDCQGSAKNVLVEGVRRVRMEVAYTWWRGHLPDPKRAVLDMLIGDPAPYSTIAIRFRMGKRRARGLLIRAIDLWPEALDYAEATVDREDIDEIHAKLSAGGPPSRGR